MSGRGTRTDVEPEPKPELEREPTPSTVGEGDSLEPSLGLDELFDLLADEKRRRVVRWLAGRDGSVERARLAAALGTDGTDADADERIETALHHVHLPALDAADVVEYDRATGVVAPAAHLDVTMSCLTTVEGVHLFAEDHA